MFLARGTDSLQDPFLELILAFLGRPAGRPVYAPLRERAAPPPGVSPARGPCLAAPPLGPSGPGSDPRFLPLDHRGGGRLRSSPQARGADARVLPGARRRRRGSTWRAARASPLRFSGPVGPARIPLSLSSISASLYVRAGLSGPPLRPPTSGCDHLRGDVCSSPGHYPPVGGGGRGETWSSPGKRRVGSVQMGMEWDVVLFSHCSGRARGATLQSQ